MNIQIQGVHMSPSETLVEQVSKKLEKLSKKYEWIVNGKVTFKEERDPSKAGKVCEIQLSVPGPNIFAKAKDNHFRKAMKESLKDVEVQLKKRKHQFVRH